MLSDNHDFFCVGVVYSGEYDACDVTTQASYSPEYITPTQKKSLFIVVARFISAILIGRSLNYTKIQRAQ